MLKLFVDGTLKKTIVGRSGTARIKQLAGISCPMPNFALETGFYTILIDIESFLDTLEIEVKDYRVPVIDLIGVQSQDPFRVLIATILSSRTKDEVTAVAAERLFSVAQDCEGLMRLSEKKIQEIIYPVGFYKSKAVHLRKTATLLSQQYNGEVPADMEALLKLPGVGRKTANLVLSVAFDIPAICVDTHVHRIMNIWGYVKTATPTETESTLRRKLPQHRWKAVNRLLVAFGQGKCKPVAPRCSECPLYGTCPRIGVSSKG